jgi:uncharacterized protein (TIGR03067 family)
MSQILLPLGMIVAALGTGERREEQPADGAAIQGPWEVVAVTEAGKDAPDRRGSWFTFTKDTLTMRPKEKKEAPEGLSVKYKLDPAAQPKAIDTTHELDPGKPIVQLGVYLLEGDTLTLCFEAAGKPRPTAIASQPGDTRNVFVLKRRP